MADFVETPVVETPLVETRVATPRGALYARDYPGAGPAFVLMHGFPDNLGIYDGLVPHLVAAGRRVVTFDFAGYGRSDKPAGAAYSFAGQRDELGAVVDALGLDRFVPVAHDASGPAAINYALAAPARVARLVILNAVYEANPLIQVPEIVTLFATHGLQALSGAIAQDKQLLGWLQTWQQQRFSSLQPPDQRERYTKDVVPLIAENLTTSGQAFGQLAAELFAELARNTTRLPELKALDVQVDIVWGALDPYLTPELARHFASLFRHASLSLLHAGHWLQADLPEEVAKAMLAPARQAAPEPV